jgi:hypothetical protein
MKYRCGEPGVTALVAVMLKLPSALGVLLATGSRDLPGQLVEY